jgi:hypothetical protein
MLVPVLNQALPQIAQVRGNFPATHLGGPPIVLPALTAVVRSVVDRAHFSFESYVTKNTDVTAELYQWLCHVLWSFRQIEERMLAEPLQIGVRRAS